MDIRDGDSLVDFKTLGMDQEWVKNDDIFLSRGLAHVWHDALNSIIPRPDRSYFVLTRMNWNSPLKWYPATFSSRTVGFR